jgi:protein-S-isoprenylcysteine O-methyltransferase Ste14
MSFDTVVRVALACFFLFVAVSYISRLLGSHARNKRALIHSGEPGSPQRFLRLLFNGFRAAILGAVIWRVVDPSIDQVLMPIEVFAQPGVEAIGLSFLVLSFAGVEYVHAYMDGEWRSGVPRAEAMVSQLLTEGPFALTRNPLFSAVILGQIGLFLAIPSALRSAHCLRGLVRAGASMPAGCRAGVCASRPMCATGSMPPRAARAATSAAPTGSSESAAPGLWDQHEASGCLATCQISVGFCGVAELVSCRRLDLQRA